MNHLLPEEAKAGRTIYFGIDGTLADPRGKEEAVPIPEYLNMLLQAKEMGYRIGIITKGRAEQKVEWLKKQGIWGLLDSFQSIPHDVSKYSVAADKTGILIDSEDADLNTWYSDHIKAEGGSRRYDK